MRDTKQIAVAVLALVIGAVATVVVLEVGALDGLVRGRVDVLAESGRLGSVLPPELAVMADAEGRDAFALRRVRELAQDKTQEWNNRWLGVPLQQYPSDLALYQELVAELAPDFVVETGTFWGGSALFFAQLLQAVNPAGRVITVDVDSKGWETSKSALGERYKDLFARIDFIHASSVDAATLAQIRGLIPPGKKVLVMLDSMHVKSHVLAELQLYSPLVSKGSYLIVNDTQLDGSAWNGGQPGPASAVREFLATSKEFEVDAARSRFTVSCTRGGVLKRVRNP